MTAFIGPGICRLWRVTFFPIMGREADGSESQVGRWMVYVTAFTMARIYDVVAHFLPEVADEGVIEPQEEILVPAGNSVWSVSIGMPGTQVSKIVTAPTHEDAYKALLETVTEEEKLRDEHAKLAGQAPLDSPDLIRYVREKVFVSRRIDLTKEGVW